VLGADRLDELDAIGEVEAAPRELKMARQLIDSLSADFDPSRFRDEYRERVLDLIERKAAGEEIAVQPEAEVPARVPDLMAALEASLAAVKDRDADSNGKGEKKDSKSSSSSKSSSGGSKSRSKAKA
jgi:DNA end-binding protein Ku